MEIHKIEQRRKQEQKEKIISIMAVMTLAVIWEIIKIYALIEWNFFRGDVFVIWKHPVREGCLWLRDSCCWMESRRFSSRVYGLFRCYLTCFFYLFFMSCLSWFDAKLMIDGKERQLLWLKLVFKSKVKLGHSCLKVRKYQNIGKINSSSWTKLIQVLEKKQAEVLEQNGF